MEIWLVGLAGGVFGGVLTRVLFEFAKFHIARFKTYRLLVSETFTTLTMLKDLVENTETTEKDLENLGENLTNNPRAPPTGVSRIFASFVVSGPQVDRHTMLAYMPPGDAVTVIRYHDRYERLLAQEILYRQKFEALLCALAEPNTPCWLVSERLVQATGSVKKLFELAKDLEYYACTLAEKVIPRLPCSTGSNVEDLSEGKSESRQKFVDNCKKKWLFPGTDTGKEGGD